MKLKQFPILLVVATLVALPMSVGAISSTSYEIVPEAGYLAPATDGYGTTSEMLESPSYQLQGSIEPYAGNPSSTTYGEEVGIGFQYFCDDGFIDPGESCDGADLNGETCASRGYDSGPLSCSSTCAFDTSGCVMASGGGGGGGAPRTATPDTPTVDEDIEDLEFTYTTPFLLYGGKDTDADTVKVNGSSTGMTYPTGSTWRDSVALSYGLNTFVIEAFDGTADSGELTYEIYRRLIGDVNEDDTVNDYDLSKLVRLWGDDDREGDFNEDGTVDDYDFSMMVARWGTSV